MLLAGKRAGRRRDKWRRRSPSRRRRQGRKISGKGGDQEKGNRGEEPEALSG